MFFVAACIVNEVVHLKIALYKDSQTCFTLDLIMSIHSGGVSTYPCFMHVLYILCKRFQTNDIRLSGLSTYAVSTQGGLTESANSRSKLLQLP